MPCSSRRPAAARGGPARLPASHTATTHLPRLPLCPLRWARSPARCCGTASTLQPSRCGPAAKTSRGRVSEPAAGAGLAGALPWLLGSCACPCPAFARLPWLTHMHPHPALPLPTLLHPPAALPPLQAADIPACERCGAPRQFEYQVMPQASADFSFMQIWFMWWGGWVGGNLHDSRVGGGFPFPPAPPPPAPGLISRPPPPPLPPLPPRPQLIVHLGVPADDPQAPDWGTIAVYCCSASCSAGVATTAGAAADESAYLQEFVWVQESA